MIEVENLSYVYSSGQILSFPSFSIGKGDHFLLLGESGSGKTSLLHVLGGLLRGYSGSVRVEGVELSQLKEGELDKFRGKKMGFVFQRNHLIPSLSVQQNLELPPFFAGEKPNLPQIYSTLGVLGMEDKKGSKVSELSQGQSQRVAIARAVINNPAYILADEPTSALDDRHCESVIQLLLDISSRYKATLVVATHDQRLKEVIKNQLTLPLLKNQL